MRELSLHILDIMQNSIRAEATQIDLRIEENTHQNILIVEVVDNGRGMPEELLTQVRNPFITTRTLRKVGLGIPLFYQLCKECGGDLSIESKVNQGTKLRATMIYDHIDRLPLGNIPSTLTTLILAKPNIDYTYYHIYKDKHFSFSTNQVKQILEDVPIQDLSIIKWIEDYIRESIDELKI